MHEVIVLGGYGRLGRYCVHHLVEGTRADVVVAGHNIQRAQSLALQYPGRARAVYAEASDPRTLQHAIGEAAMVVACCGGDLRTVLDACLTLRVPFVALTPLPLDTSQRETVAELAWQANLPVVLNAGALPGLPGVLAEALVRRFPAIPEIRIASTGPWMETESAVRDVRAFRRAADPCVSGRSRFMPLRWDFEPPVGPRPVRPGWSSDLQQFVGSHCVDRLVYLEPSFATVTRGIERLLGRHGAQPFGIAAEALLDPDSGAPDACIEIGAPHPLIAAAAAVRVLASARLAGQLPSGVLSAREAVNPAVMLTGLEKAGVQVLWD